MAYNAEIFKHQYPVVAAFVQHLAYHRGLNTARASHAHDRDFWTTTTAGHLKLAVVAWCNVFGSSKEQLHWTKAPAGATAEQVCQKFRAKLSTQSRLTNDQWQVYHERLRSFRDKYVAHFDQDQPFIGPVPDFDPALQAAYVYHEWARELISPVLLGQPTLSSLYKQWRESAAAMPSSSVTAPRIARRAQKRTK